MALTGRYDFRKTLTGKIVLRVEEEVPAFWARSGDRKVKRRWRNANLMDLTTPEMRMLMDMRMKPLVVARTGGAESNLVVVETARGLNGMPAPDVAHATPAPSLMQH